MAAHHKVGANAVVSFYVVSGYLMTKILNETYGFSRQGLSDYALNRILRLYPLYLTVALSTATLILIFPRMGTFYSSLRLPETPWQWFSNITLVQLHLQPIALVPPAWSLWIELCFYAIMMFLAQSPRIVRIWFLASVVYTVALVVEGASFSMRYTPPLAASVFFATGAFLYHHPRILAGIALPARAVIPTLLMVSAVPIFVEWLGFDRLMIGFYLSYLMFLPVLAGALIRKPGYAVAEVDRRLGDLCDPVYVLHFPVGAAVYAATSRFLDPYGATFAAVCFVVTLSLAAAYAEGIDPHIQSIRARIRSRARSAATA